MQWVHIKKEKEMYIINRALANALCHMITIENTDILV
jgi:hypothetical protein